MAVYQHRQRDDRLSGDCRFVRDHTARLSCARFIVAIDADLLRRYGANLGDIMDGARPRTPSCRNRRASRSLAIESAGSAADAGRDSDVDRAVRWLVGFPDLHVISARVLPGIPWAGARRSFVVDGIVAADRYICGWARWRRQRNNGPAQTVFVADGDPVADRISGGDFADRDGGNFDRIGAG